MFSVHVSRRRPNVTVKELWEEKTLTTFSAVWSYVVEGGSFSRHGSVLQYCAATETCHKIFDPNSTMLLSWLLCDRSTGINIWRLKPLLYGHQRVSATLSNIGRCLLCLFAAVLGHFDVILRLFSTSRFNFYPTCRSESWWPPVRCGNQENLLAHRWLAYMTNEDVSMHNHNDLHTLQDIFLSAQTQNAYVKCQRDCEGAGFVGGFSRHGSSYSAEPVPLNHNCCHAAWQQAAKFWKQNNKYNYFYCRRIILQSWK